MNSNRGFEVDVHDATPGQGIGISSRFVSLQEIAQGLEVLVEAIANRYLVFKDERNETW